MMTYVKSHQVINSPKVTTSTCIMRISNFVDIMGYGNIEMTCGDLRLYKLMVLYDCDIFIMSVVGKADYHSYFPTLMTQLMSNSIRCSGPCSPSPVYLISSLVPLEITSLQHRCDITPSTRHDNHV